MSKKTADKVFKPVESVSRTIKIELEVDPVAYGMMNVNGKMLTMDKMPMKDLVEFVVESLAGGSDLLAMVDNVKITRSNETETRKLVVRDEQ